MYFGKCIFFFSSRRRHTRCALVTGVQTCALPIFAWRQLRDRWSAQGRAEPQLLDRIRPFLRDQLEKIGRASCRERVCQYVSISVVAVSLKNKTNTHLTVAPTTHTVLIHTSAFHISLL